MKLSHYLKIASIALILASCKGDAGPTGPTGATGPSGVANINTQEYTVTSWNAATASPVYTWVATYSEPDITDENADAVLGYWSTASSGWLALPVSNVLGGNYGDELTWGFTTGYVTFSYFTGGTYTEPPSYYNGTGGFPNLTTIYFKVTVIPPAIQHKYPKANWQNAADVQFIPEVQAALNGNK